MSPVRTYCDYNATAPLRPEAAAAMSGALRLTGNPSSVHAEGRKARAAVEGARETVAASVGACRDDIAFVSGGTEAVGLALRGAMRSGGSATLIASAIEHDAVKRVEQRMQTRAAIGKIECQCDARRREGQHPARR